MNHVLLAIGMPGGPELIIILVVLLLFFGARRLPELSRSLGRSISEFKKGRSESIEDAEDQESKPADSDSSNT